MIYCKAEKCKSFFRKFHDCTVPRTERLENVTLACAVRRGCVRQAPEQQLLQAALPSFFERRMRKESDFMLWREDRPMRIALFMNSCRSARIWRSPMCSAAGPARS